MVDQGDRDSVPGWRGYAVVMFTDLSGYTTLSETADPEAVAELVRKIDARVQSAVRRYGGTVSQSYGDGFLAVFGYPLAHEDDGQRAVAAALDLHASIRALQCGPELENFEPRMHTALHGGRLFVGAGGPLAGRYALTGDVVNTASRLCGCANRDEILISDEVATSVQGFFRLERVPDRLLRGKRDPVAAHLVAARSEASTRYDARTRDGATELVGRADELVALEHALAEARQGRLQLLTLVGTPGLGKSRLLAELRLRAEAQGARVLRGVCETYDDTAPTAPMGQVLKQLLRLPRGPSSSELERLTRERLASFQPEVAESALLVQLINPTASAGADGSSPQAAGRALAALLRAIAAEAPLVLTLDDWQWADDSSRDLLAALHQECAHAAILIVVAMRPHASTDGVLARVRGLPLAPLSEAESARMVETLRSHHPNREVVRSLHRRSGGNPLFLEELCRVLPPQALHDEALDESSLPSTVHATIQARVARLPERQAEVVKAASVIGIEFTLALLQALCPGDDLIDALTALAEADVLHALGASESFRFKHGITREVIYESVLLSERRRMHATVAAALRAGSPVQLSDELEALVYHYRCAGDHEQAARFGERAGNQAMVASALDRARFQYAHALRALRKLPATEPRKRAFLRIVPSWAVACAYNSARSQLEPLELACVYAEELGAVDAHALARYSLGWILYGLGEYREALAHLEPALELARESGQTRLMEQLWATIGQTLAAAGNYRRALPMLIRGIDSKRGRRARSGQVAQGYAYALACRASLLSDCADFEAAERDLDDALSVLAGAEHPVEASVLAHAAMVWLRRGDWQRAADAAERGLEISERLHSPFVNATLTAYDAHARWRLSPSRAQLDRLAEAVRWLEQRDQGLFLSVAYGLLAELLLESGEHEHARACAERVLERAEQGDELCEPAALRVLATLCREDDVEQAEACLARACNIALERGALRDAALTRLCALQLAVPGADAGTLRADFARWGMDHYTNVLP